MTRTYAAIVRAVAAHVCDNETLERVIEPTLADLRRECDERARADSVWSRRWLLVAVSLALVHSIILCSVDRVVRECRAPTPLAEARALNTTAVISIVATTFALALFMLPPLSHVARVHWRLILYLAPQAIPIALPIGLTVGVLAGVRDVHTSLRFRARLTTTALMCSLASFITLGWMVPYANQAFREFAYAQTMGARDGDAHPRRPLTRGANELTILELRDQTRTSERSGRLGAFLYYQRWALSWATLIMVIFALVAVNRWRLGVIAGLVVAVTSCVAYWLLIEAGQQFTLTGTWRPAPGAWLPNAFFAAVAAGIAALSRVRSEMSA